MSSTECQEPSNCPQIKNGKTTQKYIPKFLATQIQQYGQTKSIYFRGQILPLLRVNSVPSLGFGHYYVKTHVYFSQ